MSTFKDLFKTEPEEMHPLENWRIMVYGPPKTGKTFLALTASPKFPEKLPAPEMVNLDDLFMLMFDEGGLDGLQEQNLFVPHIDLSKTSGAELMNGGINTILLLLKKRIQEGLTKTVVIDTLSSLDVTLTAHYRNEFEGKNGPQMYGSILAAHMKFFNGLRHLPCNVLILAHAKHTVDLGDDNQKARKKAESMPGFADTIPDITGKAGRFYARSVSIQIPMLAQKVGGKMERSLYPHGYAGFEAGSRFSRLGQKEPANLNKLILKAKGE